MLESLRHRNTDVFFFNDTATTEIYALSLHDALPILVAARPPRANQRPPARRQTRQVKPEATRFGSGWLTWWSHPLPKRVRSEEHTSELQSHLNLVCRLLLEKKKTDARARSRRWPRPD